MEVKGPSIKARAKMKLKYPVPKKLFNYRGEPMISHLHRKRSISLRPLMIGTRRWLAHCIHIEWVNSTFKFMKIIEE